MTRADVAWEVGYWLVQAAAWAWLWGPLLATAICAPLAWRAGRAWGRKRQQQAAERAARAFNRIQAAHDRQAVDAAAIEADADTTPGSDTHLLQQCEAIWNASRNTRTEDL